MKTGEVPNQVSRWIKAEIVNLELSRHDFTDVDRILTQYVEYYFHQFELAIEAIGLKYFYLIPENTTVFYKNEAGELISATLRKSVLVGKGMKAVWGKENEMILISDGTEAFYRDRLVSLPFGSSIFIDLRSQKMIEYKD